MPEPILQGMTGRAGEGYFLRASHSSYAGEYYLLPELNVSGAIADDPRLPSLLQESIQNMGRTAGFGRLAFWDVLDEPTPVAGTEGGVTILAEYAGPATTFRLQLSMFDSSWFRFFDGDVVIPPDGALPIKFMASYDWVEVSVAGNVVYAGHPVDIYGGAPPENFWLGFEAFYLWEGWPFRDSVYTPAYSDDEWSYFRHDQLLHIRSFSLTGPGAAQSKFFTDFVRSYERL